MISSNVQHLLATFDQLSDIEKHEAMIEVLRRTPQSIVDPLDEEDLSQVADELFVELDRREATP